MKKEFLGKRSLSSKTVHTEKFMQLSTKIIAPRVVTFECTGVGTHKKG